MTSVGRALRAAAMRVGVTDAAILDAVEHTSRRDFLPPSGLSSAAVDFALPIPCGQTTSQPSLIALMLESLRLSPADRVLEIGTGLGYEAALLARLVAEVWTVERVPELASLARDNLARFPHVHVVTSDGSDGVPAHAPYDAIVVAARTPSVPPALLDQLAVGGRLVAPVGGSDGQRCLVLERYADGTTPVVADLGLVTFVPLIADE